MSKIIIVGGGFGGVRAALDLEKKLGDRAEIILIDRNGYHLFAPALYEVASAFGLAKDRFSVNLRKTVSIPYGDIFDGKRIQFVQAEVAHISPEQRILTTKSDISFSFDYLVLALGSQTADFNIPGVKEYAFQFKTIEDALMLNHQLIMLFEKASRGNHDLPLRFVVGGGGFAGVELAAELACAVKHLAKKYQIGQGHSIITLAQAGPKILPQISDRERAIITRRLTELGVAIKINATIEEIKSDLVKLKDGRSLMCNVIVWTAGIRATDFIKTIQGLDLTAGGKIIVGDHLAASRYDHIFAVGDSIQFIDHKTQRPEPALAYVAVRHGQVVANNILRSLQNKKLRKHIPFYAFWIAPVGGKYAVAHLWGGISVKGLLGWVIREIVDFRYFISILSFRKAWKLFREEVQIFVKND